MYKLMIDLKEHSLSDTICKDLISIEDLLDMLENALYDIEELKTQIKDLKTDMEENYKPIPFDPYKEYGISEDMFH